MDNKKDKNTVESVFGLDKESMNVDDMLVKIHRDCSKQSMDLRAYKYACLALAKSDPNQIGFMLSLAAASDPCWIPLRDQYFELMKNFLDVANTMESSGQTPPKK